MALQGFLTAIANPKGWIFAVAFLPPFISEKHPLIPQVIILLSILLILEFICLMVYASGGSALKKLLQVRDNVKIVNRITGTLMMAVGVWLALD